MAVKAVLLKKLEELGEKEFKTFKWHLEQSSKIPKSYLENADRPDTVDKIVQTYNQWSLEVVKEILKEISRNDLVEKLSNTSLGAHGEPKETRRDSMDILINYAMELLKILEKLGDENFTDFKRFLSCTSEIPKSHLDKADRQKIVDKIVETCKQQSVEVVKKTLTKMDRKDLVEELSNITGAHGVLGAMDVKRKLLKTLEKLGDEDFTGFKWLLSCTSEIPKSHLDKADRQKTVDKIVETCKQQSVEVVKKTLKKIDRKDLVEELSNITGSHDTNTPASQCEASKYEQIISNSTLISPGSPAVYQLRPKEEKVGTLIRKTVGEKNLNKTNRTILLVGETGSGKSTLINALFNYTMGVKFEDNIWFEIVKDEKRSQIESQTSDEKRSQSESQTSDEKRSQSESQTSDEKRSQTESQTSDVTTYEIFGYKGKTLPYSLTIIDTPGFGNTEGIEKDVIVSQRLFDLFRSDDGVHELSAVGLVLKASENRVSDRQRYILDSVMSLFGKDMEENIIALITHSDGSTPKNVLKALEAANIKCAKDEKNQPVYFLFNNNQREERTEKDELPLGNAWMITEAGMEEFKDFLKESKPQKLKTTVEVLNRRVRLTACIQNLQERIKLIELKQREIQQTEEALKKHEEEMKKNEKFTVEVDEVYKEKEDINGGMWGLVFFEAAVTCNRCKENCHYPGCTMAWKPGHCEVMKDGNCTSCTGKCPVSAHVKENRRYVNKTRKVQKTLQDMKEKYEENKSESEKKKSLMENLQTEMEELTAEKIKLLDEAYQHVEQLGRIALNDNSMSTNVHLDFLIEKMEETGDAEKVEKTDKGRVQKLKEMASRVNERTRAAWKYMFG